MKYEDYEPWGLGDIYLHLMSFISTYIVQHYDPMEVFRISGDKNSDYAFAQKNMKAAAIAILDDIKRRGSIHLITNDKTFNLEDMTFDDQIVLEKEIEETLLLYVNECFKQRESKKVI